MVKRILTIIAMLAAAATFADTAITSFRNSGITFTATALAIATASFLLVAALCFRGILRIRRETAVVGAALYDNPRQQAINARRGRTAFTLARLDGSHKLVTVKNDSERYRRYMEMIQK